MSSLGASLRKRFDQEGVPSPNFFIIGAPKSATTALASTLAQHPDVFMSTPKEPHAFGEDLGRLRQRMDPADYVDLFRSATEQMRGEASVWYMRSSVVAEEIHDFCPGARIIAMLRNPVDMLYSLHAQSIKSGIEQIGDFRSALEAEPERRQGRRVRRGVRIVDQLLYSEAVKYAPQLRRYFNRFGVGAVKVVLFDEIVADPTRVMRETQDFLGVPRVDAIELLRTNERVRARSNLVQGMLRSPDRLRAMSRALLPRSARVRLASVIVTRVERINLAPSGVQPLPVELRAELTERFRPGVEQLAVLIGRDLSAWLE